MQQTFVGTVIRQDGKYIIVQDLEERYQVHLTKLFEKRVTTKVRRFHKTRTPKQLRYYRGYVLPLSAAWMGYKRHERDLCHLVLKSMYLKTIDEISGKEYVLSLAELSKDPVNTSQMTEFVEQVRDMVAMEYGYNIKDPIKDPPMRFEEVEELVTEIERGG